MTVDRYPVWIALLIVVTSCRSPELLTLPQLEEREKKNHPLSGWNYRGSTREYHVLTNYTRGSERDFLLPLEWLQFEEPFRYRKKRDKIGPRVSISFQNDHVRFNVKDQNPQRVPYNTHYDWHHYRYGPNFAAHRERDRPSLELWNGMKLYADRIEKNSASGRVFIDTTLKSRLSSTVYPPDYAYGDRAEFSIERQDVSLRGSVGADWAKGRRVGTGKDSVIRIIGDHYDTAGPTRWMKRRHPKDKVSLGAPEMRAWEAPDLTAYKVRDRPSLPLWNGITLFADEIQDSKASGHVLIDFNQASSESTGIRAAYGDEAEISQPEKSLLLGGIRAVESANGLGLASSANAQVRIRASKIEMDDVVWWQGD